MTRKAGLADGIHVDELFDGIHVLVGHVAPFDDTGFHGQVEVEFDDLGGAELVGLGGDLAGFLVEQQRAVAAEDFQAVPFRRVMAGGEDQSVGGIEPGGGIGDQRGGGILGEQCYRDVVPGKHLGGSLGGPVRKEAPVIADQYAAFFLSLAGDLVRQCLRQPADVVHGEPLADDGPPAAGPKGDLVFGLRAVRPEETFLQDEFCICQVFRRIDPLDFILVIGLVTFDQQAGADELVDAIGQPQAAVPRVSVEVFPMPEKSCLHAQRMRRY